ncbi:hypothetical protein BBOV_II002380 [Babesia bovis T2Bo]|uniref:Trafficking protein particle complex subunit 13 C-terminal domain-containing protein n=1 Tax=Babesia bovis TaxID=5865 RepID=A7ATD3_BABBO|nr:hypothetical protein BBOV_II002380 [Babesia bovis T2Bo]EDO06194.1 hypothetical protein BBOV_II002380 [Babesia bovis T2Bo]|eukprot:XP_001609762.1 hypothetical protein [Babesia bovis T2Bo]
MAHDSPPILVVMRLSSPGYESAAWQLIDASDALVALETESLDHESNGEYLPVMVLPQYVNECFLGETLNLSLMLYNPNKTACANVKLTVEVLPENRDVDPVVIDAVKDISIGGNSEPHQSTVSHKFTRPLQHLMNFILVYNFGKKEYQVVKRAVWNVVNPLQVDFVRRTDSIGRLHLEAILTNTSTLSFTIKDIKLVYVSEDVCLEPLFPKSSEIDAVCVLKPTESHSVVFLCVNPVTKLYLKAFWQCHERGSGEFNIPVSTDHTSPLIYETVYHPGTVPLIQDFKIVFRITNVGKEPLDAMIRFNEDGLRPLAVQVGSSLDVGHLVPAESRLVEVPFISTAKGHHTIKGIEIYSSGDLVVPITDLQVLTV